MQPPTLPREDINALGVKYRRIPILSIGRDVYCDSRLILQKLEDRFPSGALGASQPDQKAVEKLLEKWVIDGGIFARAAQLIPTSLPALRDPVFLADREDYFGNSFSRSAISKKRPEALVHMRDAFEFLEFGFLADGRQWILGTETPSLADIEDAAVWVFRWVVELKGALPPSLISGEQFPKVYSWIDRFSKAISSAKASAPKPTTLRSAEAIKHILQADFAESEGQVDENDPVGLKKDQDVESWPIDTGSNHRDRGRLVALTSTEVVLASPSKVGGKEIHIHHPRTSFTIQAVGGAKL
ncbi:hypothetical protein MMC07_007210 [Pseudocyphellaria aurata]|nr:hypothetical protein [Pseudocyphellaria aurata]